VTVKKSLFDHTDMLLGRTGIRLSKNIEENLAFSQTEFDEHIKGKAFFRLKLVKRFVKCGWVEYGLSSILQRELLADDKADEFKEELLTNIREGTLKDYLPGLMA
jgi:predicted DNA-binding transcriptional regulator